MRIKQRTFVIISIVLLVTIASAAYLIFPSKHVAINLKKAAIIDGLSKEFPNHDFIYNAPKLIREGGYQVEVYNYSSVTVNFYAELPSRG